MFQSRDVLSQVKIVILTKALSLLSMACPLPKIILYHTNNPCLVLYDASPIEILLPLQVTSFSPTQGRPSSDAEDYPLSAESKIEAALLNWTVDCPNVPLASITSSLTHLHSFFPSLDMTARTFLNTRISDNEITPMHLGRYAHIANWRSCIVEHLKRINYDISYIEVCLNIDGIPLFSDARTHHAY